MNEHAVMEGQREPNRPSARLLLHAVDGVIPFLTPSLCRRCFPADQVRDVLLIGIAVRDTCLVPIYKKDKQPKAAGSSKGAPSKPRGYEFLASAKLDHFVQPYERVTVPTFDLYQDASTVSAGKKKEALDIASMDLPSASAHVSLWTINGRHQITSEQYKACAANLDSAIAVPLFDMIPPGSNIENSGSVEDIILHKRRLKRMQAVAHRNQQWTESMLVSSRNKVLLPLAVASDVDPIPEDMAWISEKLKGKAACGVALVGYQYIHNAERRWEVLQCTRAGLSNCPSASLAVVSTTSTTQIVEFLRFSQSSGCEVIVGTHLPTVWARSKRAFVCNISSWRNEKSEGNGKKRQRLVLSDLSAWTVDMDGCFDLNPKDNVRNDEHPWFRDKQPLVSGCTCMTCSAYSRAYLYHLVCSKELLAEMLLFIHNLHHLLTMLRVFNQLLSNSDTDGAASFCASVQSQLGSAKLPVPQRPNNL